MCHFTFFHPHFPNTNTPIDTNKPQQTQFQMANMSTTLAGTVRSSVRFVGLNLVEFWCVAVRGQRSAANQSATHTPPVWTEQPCVVAGARLHLFNREFGRRPGKISLAQLNLVRLIGAVRP